MRSINGDARRNQLDKFSKGTALRAGPTVEGWMMIVDLAAYLLGYGSRDLWRWHAFSWTNPEAELKDRNVPQAVALLQEVRIALAGVMGSNVFQELVRVLEDCERLNSELLEAYHDPGHFRGFPFGSSTVPGQKLWEELCTLCDAAVVDDPLRRLYRSGVELGQYQVKLELDDLDEDDDNCLEGIGPVARAITELSGQLCSRSPILQSIVDLAPTLEREGTLAFLAEFINRNPETRVNRVPATSCSEPHGPRQ